ncbi:hypothetical protein JCGZ_05429 [Jatropha curcas]|uniref:Uncharacterized protein n=2 Tax=Jatropha curcas TaxID=180498 RepID=A0A067L6A6_JATCU|nr:hypothetical protein JCGZ_05429 [Jatropha curcas]
MRKVIFPPDSQDIIRSFALLGFSMFLFLSAVKMDAGMILNTGKDALSVGISSVMIPVIFGVAHQELTTHKKELKGSWTSMIMTSLTNYPVTAYLIGDQLKISNSELGRLGLSSALVADILGIFTAVILEVIRSSTMTSLATSVLPIIAFVLVLIFIVRPAMFWVIRKTPEGKPIDMNYVNIILALALGSEVYFHNFGLYKFMGPFIFGLVVPAGAPLGSALVEKFSPFTWGVLSRILITTSMMKADLTLIVNEFPRLKTYISLIFMTYGFKFLACLAPPLLSGMPLIDSFALSLIMNYKGIVELCGCIIFKETKVISEELFALEALYILFSATVYPILIKCLYNPSRKYVGYKPRNIVSLKPRSELRVLACIHRPDNVLCVSRLLDASNPSKETPINVNVLHLIKLVGKSTPVLVSHSKQKPTSNSFSQTIIHAFGQYEKKHWDSVSVQTFTAISSPELMYEDICTLALDKLTSLILMPLHLKWSLHGQIECEDPNLRALNFKVLEKAPCSVGIFFDRGRLGRQALRAPESVLSLCLIFIGGNDDREALSLAKRMANNNPNVNLTILHFKANKEGDTERIIESEDEILDDVALEDMKRITTSKQSIVFKEHVVKDGPETLLVIRSIANDYDLFIMGRRYGSVSSQTDGLSEWSELPELGIVGDFFASSDLDTRTSVLVIQQQKQIKGI